jgi:nicotinate-nucleotide--dimethylbenzimidazole phosphoribosyltransferase
MTEATPERTTLQPRVGYVDKPAGDRTGRAPRLPLEGSCVDFTVAGQCRIFTDFAAGTSLKRTQAPPPYQFASVRIGPVAHPHQNCVQIGFSLKLALVRYRTVRVINTGVVFPLISLPDPEVALTAREHLDRLTKPVGSLGRLEHLATQLSSISGLVPPPIPQRVALCVFAGDHGVVEEGVTNWPSEVTGQMVANFASGGAAVSVLTKMFDIDLTVVDVGVSSDISHLAGVTHRKVKAGTANFMHHPAMTLDEAKAAVQVGLDIANESIDQGAQLLATGEMGIGNTTTSAAIICALTGSAPTTTVGRGTGIADSMHAHKTAVVASAVSALGTQASDPWHVLTEVGGLEIAALVGFIIGGAARKVPVILDGVITLAAALLADQFADNLRAYLIAGHRSTEPGASIALQLLDIDPILELDLRLGEGSGAAASVPIVRAAAALLNNMATFDGAGVTDKT